MSVAVGESSPRDLLDLWVLYSQLSECVIGKRQSDIRLRARNNFLASINDDLLA